MPTPSPTSPPRLRLGSCLGGLALLATYAAVVAVVDAGSIAARQLNYISPGEHFLWLAHALMALPGVLLLAWGWSPRLAPAVGRLRDRVARWGPVQWRAAAAGYFLLLLLLAVVGRSVVLLDLPITDDENSVAFGGKMLARGHLSVPVLQPDGAFPERFLYRREGRISSMDFPGAIAAAAASEATGLGSWLYALLAAATGLAVAYSAALLGGRTAAWVAALIWLCSPMVVTLSMTTHAHLVSRTCVAAAVPFYLRVLRSGKGHDAVGFGAAYGLGMLVRPFEVGALVLPLAAHIAVRALRGGAPRSTLVLAGAPLAGAAALFAWYNARITGVWWLPARFAPGGMAAESWTSYSIVERLALNLGFNVVLLGFFFLGAAGLLLVAAGLKSGAGAGRCLFAGILLALGLALLHDNIGIHTVGPIHYSESAVPMSLLAALGILRLKEIWHPQTANDSTAGLLAACYLILGLSFFTPVHWRSLRVHAHTEQLPFAAAARQGIHDAVVLAPSPLALRGVRPDLAPLGGWVHDFPPPDPFLRDDVLWARPNSDVEKLRRQFPNRKLFRMLIRPGVEPLVLAPLDP
jgi:Dolichyl-phosphate-mannose-protein mannosyltransferase